MSQKRGNVATTACFPVTPDINNTSWRTKEVPLSMREVIHEAQTLLEMSLILSFPQSVDFCTVHLQSFLVSFDCLRHVKLLRVVSQQAARRCHMWQFEMCKNKKQKPKRISVHVLLDILLDILLWLWRIYHFCRLSVFTVLFQALSFSSSDLAQQPSFASLGGS